MENNSSGKKKLSAAKSTQQKRWKIRNKTWQFIALRAVRPMKQGKLAPIGHKAPAFNGWIERR